MLRKGWGNSRNSLLGLNRLRKNPSDCHHEEAKPTKDPTVFA
jgi:hypothetical protein